MRYQIRKDRKLRKSYKKVEERYLVLKALKTNSYLSKNIVKKVQEDIKDLEVKKIRIKNRCVVTGRKHGIITDLKISRLVFKERAQEGKLEGIKKSSW